MELALRAYLKRIAAGEGHHAASVAAARAVRARPWDVVHHAGRLARCTVATAPRDLGLTATLREVSATSRAAIARIDAGQPYPCLAHRGRRARGAFDTPVDMARKVVQATLRSVEGSRRTGLDLACGPGAFLLAMTEAGVPEVFGTDIDATALAVAQVACPRARLLQEDALKHGPEVDVLCGNPPYVPPERQDRALRLELRRRFPWLHGRFDLVVPFAAVAAERVRPGGGLGLVLPTSAMVQPYGRVLRERWVRRHAFRELVGPLPFPGASVDVTLMVLVSGAGPAPLPPHGVAPDDVLALPSVPLDPLLMPGDRELVERIRAASVPLGELCHIDTGLVAHGPHGGKAELLCDTPGEGRVPYADARGFFRGERQWLDYRADSMHRPKTPELFERPKVVLQRLRGRAPVRAAIDLEGTYVGHTCTVVQPTDRRVSLEAILELVRSELVDALVRIERGSRLDLYPRDVASMPFPTAWLGRTGNLPPLAGAWALDTAEVARLRRRAVR